MSRARQLCYEGSEFIRSWLLAVSPLPDRRVVVDLDKVAVRIFKVDLPDAVNANGRLLCRSRPVGVVYLVFVEVCNKRVYVFDTEAKMVVTVAFVLFLAAFDKMQMPGPSDGEPGMLAIVKGFRDLLKAQYVLVKSRAVLQIGNINSHMVQRYGNVRIITLRKQDIAAGYADKRCQKNFFHSRNFATCLTPMRRMDRHT